MDEYMIELTRSSLQYEIAAMAYVAADIKEGTRDAHALHQTFDICEEGNVDRIDRMLDLAFAAIPLILGDVVAVVASDARSFRIILRCGATEITRMPLIRCAAREYLVASVLAGWLSVTLPEAASAWREKASVARASLAGCARRANVTGRRVSPLA